MLGPFCLFLCSCPLLSLSPWRHCVAVPPASLSPGVIIPPLLCLSFSCSSSCHPSVFIIVSPSSPCHRCLVLLLIVAAAGHCHCHSIHDPPHEQLLMGLEVGGVSGIVVGWSLWSPEAIHSSHNPPYEQRLIGMGWVLCCSVVGFLFFRSWSWSQCWCLSSLWRPALIVSGWCCHHWIEHFSGSWLVYESHQNPVGSNGIPPGIVGSSGILPGIGGGV